MLLSDGYLANGSEPWRIPERRRAAGDRPGLRRPSPTTPAARATTRPATSGPTCATRRPWPGPWAVPGTPGLEHRIGGLEKSDGHGNISYDPGNHDYMVRMRQAKVDRIAESLPPLEVDDPSGPPDKARPGCWSSVGARRTARSVPPAAACARPGSTSPRCTCATSTRSRRDLGEILKQYDAVMVPEMNLGQLSMLLRAKYLVDVVGYNHVRGLPLKAAELAEAVTDLIAATTGDARATDAENKESVR